jgi:hypothetical protein
MKILLPILLVLILFSCRNHDKNESSSKTAIDTQAVVLDPPVPPRKLSKYEAAILQQLNLIDSATYGNRDVYETYYDSLDTVNARIFNTLTQMANDGNTYKDFALDASWFTYLVSDDKRFCLASWRAEMGGTFYDITNAALFKIKDKMETKWLRDTSNENEGQAADIDILFDTLFTIHTTSGKSIYLTYGNGQAQGISPMRALMAFSINDSLQQPAIFPEGKEIFLNYELTGDIDDSSLDIKLLDKGRRLLIPILKGGMPSGRYQKLVFDGERYVERK